jgi:FMN phosphatase YigB (HAD superfamily)
MIRAVIFDFYGVLALNGWQAFKTLHFTDRPELWDQVFELGRKVDAGSANYDELVAFTARVTGESEPTVRYQLEHTVADKRLLQFIQTELKPHYKLGVLSNASSNVVGKVLAPEDEALFDAIVLSHHVGLTKPDPKMYKAVVDKLGVGMEEALLVDDQERHANGARVAGMQALVYKDFDEFTKDIRPLLQGAL